MLGGSFGETILPTSYYSLPDTSLSPNTHTHTLAQTLKKFELQLNFLIEKFHDLCTLDLLILGKDPILLPHSKYI